MGPVEVYERESAGKVFSSEVKSINITLCARGLAVFHELDYLLNLNLASELLEKAVGLEGRLIHIPNGKLAAQPYGLEGQCIYLIRRSVLLATLRKTVEACKDGIVMTNGQKTHKITVHFEHVVLGLDTRSNSKDTTILRMLNTATNSLVSTQARLIVGADGAHSQIRRLLAQRSLMDYSVSHLSYGYMDLSLDPTSESLAKNSNLFHFWPRHDMMMWAMANRDGSFSSTVVMP
jgi:kynurenine 3-monooxygenase